MSSTLSPPKTTERVTVRPIPTEGVVAVEARDDAEFAGFVRAIAIGVAIGVPVVAVLTALLVQVTAPGLGTAGTIAIAVWVAIWIGVFLGGTVTVGLWSAKQHRNHEASAPT
jgi:hypothetical protein